MLERLEEPDKHWKFNSGDLKERDRWDEYLGWAVECFRISTSGVADETQIQTHMCYSEFGDIMRQIQEMDADVLLMDSLIPDSGANFFNIHGIADKLRVNIADVRQESTMNHLVRDREVIFNLAGQVSHIDSMRDPYTDLEINCRAQLSILEACRKYNRNVRIVFAGTRQVYGRPDYLPVDEKHLVRPADINGINKAAGEYYHLVYNNVFGVRACSLRLTNIYGPRQVGEGAVHHFIVRALKGQPLHVHNDGAQIRAWCYVDDIVDGIMLALTRDEALLDRCRRVTLLRLACLNGMLLPLAGAQRTWKARHIDKLQRVFKNLHAYS